ncbi:MAG: response regulator [Bifidobacteriaceae bacterium]|jgi:DNA-binding response OmpR family regulator|nr:response regulator [Bifidobacteriaceae bacterium]
MILSAPPTDRVNSSPDCQHGQDGDDAVGGQPVRILVYSDNAEARGQVIDTLGDTIGADQRPVQWTEAATHEMAMILCQEDTYDLVVMDNEATRLGGVGLTRQMRDELDWAPTVLLLLARQQDAWLAAWSGADAALLQPVDPFELAETVVGLVGLEQV